MKTKLIKEPVFETFIRYFWDGTITEFIKWLDDKFNLKIEIDEANNWHGVTVRETKKDGSGSVVAIWTEDESQLFHETSHAIFWWMDRRGIPHNQDTEEVFCYLADFYMKEIMKARKKKHKKKVKKRK